jgi:hypothetical protein
MPTYKNRPPTTGHEHVWRYLSLEALSKTITTRQLRLTRIDKFLDPFEASVPKQEFDNQILLLAGATSLRQTMNIIAVHHPGMATVPPPDEDLFARLTRLRRAMAVSSHASCWSVGDESELMWRLFCNDGGHQGVGIALRSTLYRLEESVAAHDLYVSPITYLKYHEAPAFTDEMDFLLHKRHGLAAEHELRLLKFDKEHRNALIPKDASVPELPDYIYLEWELSKAVEEIFISPYADDAYGNLVLSTITDPDLAKRVKLSELHPRRYPPYR